MAHVFAELLAAAEVDVTIQPFDDVRQAIELGDVDLVPGYTGATWVDVLGRPEPPGDPETSFRRVRQIDASRGMRWIAPSFGEGRGEPPANATFAFVVAPDAADPIDTMSQLASRLSEDPDALLCVDPEFAARRDGLEQVLDAYAIRLDVEVLGLVPAAAVEGVVAGDCLAGLATATDGRAWSLGLRPLTDDLHVFPAFVVAGVLRDDVHERLPEVEAALAPLSQHLTTELLGTWNARVAGGELVTTVARDAAATLLELAIEPSPSPAVS